LQAGLDSLNAPRQNDEERQEIFEIKKQIVSSLVKRITINRNRKLQVEISINLLNLSTDDPTKGFEGQHKEQSAPARVYPGWRYFLSAARALFHI
jgi:hypothetical protein